MQDEAVLAVQVNGKFKARLTLETGLASDVWNNWRCLKATWLLRLIRSLQLATYLDLTGLWLGLLLNFNAATMRGDLKRVVNG